MERTISTKDLKAKLERKDSLKVVETLRPSVTAKPTFPAH
jgi:hypothetical protein